MQVHLRIFNKTSNESVEASFTVEEKVTIGRYLNSPVLLTGEALSRYHFAFHMKEGGLEIEDLSSNGTWLNGEALKVNTPARVKSGDIVEISGYRMEVTLGVRDRTRGTVSGTAATPSIVAVLAPAAQKPAWVQGVNAALTFFSGFELILILLAVSTLALSAFYLTL